MTVFCMSCHFYSFNSDITRNPLDRNGQLHRLPSLELSRCSGGVNTGVPGNLHYVADTDAATARACLSQVNNSGLGAEGTSFSLWDVAASHQRYGL